MLQRLKHIKRVSLPHQMDIYGENEGSLWPMTITFSWEAHSAELNLFGASTHKACMKSAITNKYVLSPGAAGKGQRHSFPVGCSLGFSQLVLHILAELSSHAAFCTCFTGYTILQVYVANMRCYEQLKCKRHSLAAFPLEMCANIV